MRSKQPFCVLIVFLFSFGILQPLFCAQEDDLVLDGSPIHTEIISKRMGVNALEDNHDIKELNYVVVFFVYRVLQGSFPKEIFRVAVHSPVMSFGIVPKEYHGAGNKQYRLRFKKTSEGFRMIEAEPIKTDTPLPPIEAKETGLLDYVQGMNNVAADKFEEAHEDFLRAQEKLKKYNGDPEDAFKDSIEVLVDAQKNMVNRAAAKELLAAYLNIEMNNLRTLLKIWTKL